MSRVYAEAAAAELARPVAGTERQEAVWRVAALIPHTYRAGTHDCRTCGLPFDADIHHWDERRAA